MSLTSHQNKGVGQRRAGDFVCRLVSTAVLGLILCAPLAAQCAMCRESAAFQREEAINALRSGIIILAIPPTAIILGIACVTYRHRGTPDDPEPPIG